jgi:hypothetical protein
LLSEWVIAAVMCLFTSRDSRCWDNDETCSESRPAHSDDDASHRAL